MQVAQSHILLSFQYLKIERLCNLFEQLMLLLAFFHSPHQIQLQVCFGFSNHTHTSSLHSLSILLLGSSLFLLLACSHLLLSLLGDACSPSQGSCHICLSFCFSRWSNLKFGGAVWKSTNSAALLLFTTVFYGIIPSRALQSPKSAFLNTRTMVLIFGNFFFLPVSSSPGTELNIIMVIVCIVCMRSGSVSSLITPLIVCTRKFSFPDKISGLLCSLFWSTNRY